MHAPSWSQNGVRSALVSLAEPVLPLVVTANGPFTPTRSRIMKITCNQEGRVYTEAQNFCPW